MQRVVAGTLRGRKLLPVPAGVPGLRPTASRVREAIFARIGDEVEGTRVLDLFGGSGALSIEALSRGAAFATVCELDGRVARHLAQQLEVLGLAAKAEVARGDATRWLAGGPGTRARYDLVFVDPPFASPHVFDPVVAALVEQGWLAPRALVVCERERVRGQVPPLQLPAVVQPEALKIYGQVQVEYLRAP
ncbi:MAG: 16S rRNA (guanine(966)-N(2))-methyltransferase RsmD [Nannocystaceae bacterium]|nr:16S rRNA (guanine(966)-N(2))-methyltransferase RsmD [Nannocystaceae bacterium]